MNILYIEEDAFFAEGVKRAFTSAGLDIVHTPRADQVMDLVEEEEPTFILLALRLSKLNGFELLRLLKQDERTRNIPVMVWSQLSTREDIQRCFDLGACEYFLKGQHHPRDVISHLRGRFSTQDGFTLPEWLCVGAALLLALLFVSWQIQRVVDLRRDDGQMAAVRAYVSALVAAQQERAFLRGCEEVRPGVRPLYTCTLCKDEACRVSLPVPWTAEPGYERRWLDPEHECTQESFYPCHVTIEPDGSQPLSTEAFKLRFFLTRDREGLKGGKTHTINAGGVVE